METEVKLTKLAECAGCGAKVGAGELAQLAVEILVVAHALGDRPQRLGLAANRQVRTRPSHASPPS